MTIQVNLESMHERHRALTEAVAAFYKEAASVCLSRHHVSPLSIVLSDNGTKCEGEVCWCLPDARTNDAWANSTDATEAGAYGCVIAALECMRSLFAVRRAETGTGADYYVGPVGSGENDLEDCLRLEISGVDSGSHDDVVNRLNAKIKQAHRGKSNLPALAGVIGFSAKLLILGDAKEGV